MYKRREEQQFYILFLITGKEEIELTREHLEHRVANLKKVGNPIRDLTERKITFDYQY